MQLVTTSLNCSTNDLKLNYLLQEISSYILLLMPRNKFIDYKHNYNIIGLMHMLVFMDAKHDNLICIITKLFLCFRKQVSVFLTK